MEARSHRGGRQAPSMDDGSAKASLLVTRRYGNRLTSRARGRRAERYLNAHVDDDGILHGRAARADGGTNRGRPTSTRFQRPGLIHLHHGRVGTRPSDAHLRSDKHARRIDHIRREPLGVDAKRHRVRTVLTNANARRNGAWSRAAETTSEASGKRREYGQQGHSVHAATSHQLRSYALDQTEGLWD